MEHCDKDCALAGGGLPACSSFKSLLHVSLASPVPSLFLSRKTICASSSTSTHLKMGTAPHLPVSKPSRSEVDPQDPHEQHRITEQVRLQFEAEAPRRHPKPCRSDPNSSSDVEVNISATPIPEFLKFQSLIQASMTQPVLTEFHNIDSEDFVETDYYKDLNAVDKTLHHTTGSGFIQVETSFPDDTSVVNKLKLSRPPHTFVRIKSHCNPATNDWIPSSEYTHLMCGANCRLSLLG